MFKYMPAGDGTVLSDIAFISKSMSKHPVDEVLSAELVMDKFSASTIKMFLNAMMDTSNLVILVGDKAYQYSETVPEVNKPTGESKVGSDPLDLSFVADNHLDIHNELYNLDYS
jgi:secreted Zn-dependent insulinase-like peptidase